MTKEKGKKKELNIQNKICETLIFTFHFTTLLYFKPGEKSIDEKLPYH